MKLMKIYSIFLLYLILSSLKAENLTNIIDDENYWFMKRSRLDCANIIVKANYKNNNLFGENAVFYSNGNLKLYAEIQQNSDDPNKLSGYFKKFNENGFLTDYIEFYNNELSLHKVSNDILVLNDPDSLQIISEDTSDSLLISFLYPLRKNSTPKNNTFDLPPYPIDISFVEFPNYAMSRIKGNCYLYVEIFYDGYVGEVIVVQSLMAGPGGLDEAAINSVKTWKFTPAKKNDKDISCWVTFPIWFNSWNQTISLGNFDDEDTK